MNKNIRPGGYREASHGADDMPMNIPTIMNSVAAEHQIPTMPIPVKKNKYPTN